MISNEAALFWCLSMTIIFVSSLYLLVPSRIRKLDRNDFVHIQYRSLSMLFSCIISYIGTYYLLQGRISLLFNGLTVYSTIFPLFTYVMLFIGPLIQIVVLPHSTSFNINTGLWTDLRNIVIAPASEEIVFRSFMGSILLAASFSSNFIIFGTPLFFGLAHVHHGFLAVSRKERSVVEAVQIVLFQVCYTTFFGALVMDSLLRTENILSSILIHSWCNLMGFPNFLALFEQDYPRKERIVVGLAYLLGIYCFVKLNGYY